MWKGQDYWKPKYSEVAAGNKLKVGTVGGVTAGSRAQDNKTEAIQEREGGQKRAFWAKEIARAKALRQEEYYVPRAPRKLVWFRE